MTLTAVSLFAAAVEIDVAARGVLADHFPETALFNDVCEVTADDLRAAGFDTDRGILVAGWPCQDLSLAGRRLGLGGARSGLFWQVIRLLTDLRPRWFLLENVPGLLSAVCSCPGLNTCGLGCDDPHPLPGGGVCGFVAGGGHCADHGGDHHSCPGGKRRVCERPCTDPHAVRGGACGYTRGAGRCMELHGGAMGAVLGALADLGYGVAYRVLDAQYTGVPQRRRRVIFVGRLGDWAAPVEVLLEPEGGGGDPAPGGTARQGTAVISALRAGSGGGCGPDDNDAQGGRLIVGPLQAAGADGRGYRIDAEWAKGTGGPAGDEAQNLIAFDWKTDGGDRARPNISTEHTSTLATTKQDAVATGVAVRRLTPLECERLQGFPDYWTATSDGKPQADSPRYRQLGNTVAVPVIEWATRRIVAVDEREDGDLVAELRRAAEVCDPVPGGLADRLIATTGAGPRLAGEPDA